MPAESVSRSRACFSVVDPGYAGGLLQWVFMGQMPFQVTPPTA